MFNWMMERKIFSVTELFDLKDVLIRAGRHDLAEDIVVAYEKKHNLGPKITLKLMLPSPAPNQIVDPYGYLTYKLQDTLSKKDVVKIGRMFGVGEAIIERSFVHVLMNLEQDKCVIKKNDATTLLAVLHAIGVVEKVVEHFDVYVGATKGTTLKNINNGNTTFVFYQ
jgi:hypothetical protein